MSASGGAIQRFNLYNFFSVLLPGIVFSLAIVPLLPSEFSFDPIAAIIPLIAIGFVVGQAIHSFSIKLQGMTDSPTHREEFISYLSNRFDGSDAVGGLTIETNIDKSDVGASAKIKVSGKTSNLNSPPLVRSFYKSVVKKYPDLNLDPDFSSRNNSKQTIQSLYVLVRSRIHSEGTGRSRVMQSTYAFCRSVWGSSIILSSLYFVYGLGESSFSFRVRELESFIPYLTIEFPYETMLEASVLPESSTLYVAPSILFLSYFTFAYATEEYKGYFIQYLFSDYLLSVEDD